MNFQIDRNRNYSIRDIFMATNVIGKYVGTTKSNNFIFKLIKQEGLYKYVLAYPTCYVHHNTIKVGLQAKEYSIDIEFKQEITRKEEIVYS